MIQKEIIAANITNLTDARYFAAQGVQYLMFDLGEISINQIVEIKEWVSGPEILLFAASDAHLSLEEAILKIEPFAIGTLVSDIGQIEYLAPHVTLFSLDTMGCIRWSNQYFGEGEKALEDSTFSGVILKGSSEEKVGFKSFDELDLIFEKIHSIIH